MANQIKKEEESKSLLLKTNNVFFALSIINAINNALKWNKIFNKKDTKRCLLNYLKSYLSFAKTDAQ